MRIDNAMKEKIFMDFDNLLEWFADDTKQISDSIEISVEEYHERDKVIVFQFEDFIANVVFDVIEENCTPLLQWFKHTFGAEGVSANDVSKMNSTLINYIDFRRLVNDVCSLIPEYVSTHMDDILASNETLRNLIGGGDDNYDYGI